MGVGAGRRARAETGGGEGRGDSAHMPSSCVSSLMHLEAVMLRS
jgi:hypothetical protein